MPTPPDSLLAPVKAKTGRPTQHYNDTFIFW